MQTRGLARNPARRNDQSRGEFRSHGSARTPCQPRKENSMTWQTPTATDFRFGFEITMYVAAR